MLTSSGGGGRSMLTVADRGEGGIKFAKILLTSYVNAPICKRWQCGLCKREPRTVMEGTLMITRGGYSVDYEGRVF